MEDSQNTTIIFRPQASPPSLTQLEKFLPLAARFLRLCSPNLDSIAMQCCLSQFYGRIFLIFRKNFPYFLEEFSYFSGFPPVGTRNQVPRLPIFPIFGHLAVFLILQNFSCDYVCALLWKTLKTKYSKRASREKKMDGTAHKT